MKLTKARVQNYRSIEDSGEFEIGDLTCLVGKNEAGKTALLNAIRGLRPRQPFEFDETIDYPRRFATKFDTRHPTGKAVVITTWWKLDAKDKSAVAEVFGPDALKKDVIQISYGHRYSHREWDLHVDDSACLKYLVSKHGLDAPEKNALHGAKDGPTAEKALANLEQRTTNQDALLSALQKCRKSDFSLATIDILERRQPRFFYTSHFERMSGMISIEKLKKDIGAETVSNGDQIFLDFLKYAGTTIDELSETDRREALKAKCESASNDITDEIFQFWSQNNALEVVIDIDSGKASDPPPFNSGTVADIRIRNTNHKATLPLSERSAGFVWFFSFLAQFKELKNANGEVIILLDEPGLTLHGKAQGDLLRYIAERLLPQHQVIFTTHSPFMVPTDRLADIRIVEDVVVTTERGRPEVKGTKVQSDVLLVGDETLFPLQGALGYEITQSLFIGTNTLLVEGPSDILYLQVMSQALVKRRRTGLHSGWTLCPSGGIDKIAPFVRLFGGNRLNVAVLSDIASGDKKKVEKLKKSNILKAGHFFTCADFLEQDEADIEDFLGPTLFTRILNEAYSPPKEKHVTPKALEEADATPRVVKKAEALFRLMPPEVAEFDHFRPSRWLLENSGLLDEETDEVSAALDRAEAAFKTLNSLIPSS